MGLSSGQMARMSRLLDEALPLDAAGRRAWLERLPRDDQDFAPLLREALLPGGASNGNPDRLVTLPKLCVSDPGESLFPSGMRPDDRVGPYELVRPLGMGGMAEVWLARRVDGALEREVALKLPLLTRALKGLKERFIRERDILAALEHPNIARLYDAGIDTRGLPYLAMEYVRGQPLNHWCDDHLLGIPERLALLLQVLGAVQYAHERRVIHRDLKPSNILVTEAGQVRLLDFGVAKLLEESETHQAPITSLYGRALTPEYASPELLRGDAIDARSDLYSIGTLLYELLTGCRVHGLNGTSRGTLAGSFAAADIRKPSINLTDDAPVARGMSREKLARQLRGDLDVITLKALAREPDERYSTAVAMADDLQRYLQHRPIRARPAALSYRIKKYVARNRTASAFAMLTLFAFLTLTEYETHREVLDPLSVLPAAQPLGEKSIAVLPFVDISAHKGPEYFTDGLSEQLIDTLSRVVDLKVISRTSSFFFKGRQATTAQIARILGTAHILEGTVRQSGDQVRVTVQLVRASDGVQLWSRAYNRPLGDALELQDDIAQAVTGSLRSTLWERPPGGAAGTARMDAYNFYLLALSVSRYGDSKRDLDSEADYLHRALKIDPAYASAWALLSSLLANQAQRGFGSRTTLYQQAREAAQQAVSLRPDLSEGHTALAKVHYLADWDLAATDLELQRALTLNANDPLALAWSAQRAIESRQFDRAILLSNRAARIDPLNLWRYIDSWRALYYAGRYTEALRGLTRLDAFGPDDSTLHWFRACTLLAMGQVAAALEEIDAKPRGRTEALDGKDLVADLAVRTLILDASGRHRDADVVFERLLQRPAVDSAYEIGRVYAYRGDVDRAFDWFERARRQHDDGVLYLNVDPLLEHVHADPRFGKMLADLQLINR